VGLRRTISIVVGGLLATAVAASVFVGNRDSSSKKVRVVRGIVSAETQALFDDPRVKDVFAEHGLDVHVDSATDRDLTSRADLSTYDFALSSAGAAAKVASDRHTRSAALPFFTTIACATFANIATVLRTAGVARDRGGSWTLDVKGFMALVKGNPRWRDLAGNTAYRSGAVVTIASGGVEQSSAAALYAAVAGYVANNDTVLDTYQAVDGVINAVSPLFVRQGGMDRSWDAPFEDYVSLGVEKTPIALVDESQFVARSLAGDGSIGPNMVLMYPAPTVVSRYGLVALGAAGDSVGRLLADDSGLAQLAVAHGFRVPAPVGPAKSGKIEAQLRSVVEVPSYDILASLVAKLDIAEHLEPSSVNVHRSGRP
jgi:hypothetical protein